MIYNYKIDIKDNIFLTKHNVDEHSVFLNEFEVKVLKRVLDNDLLGNFLERLDCLRNFLEEGSIDSETHYRLVAALVTQSFKAFFKIAEPKYYVHVLPTFEGYLNIFPDDDFYLDDNEERGNAKTKFTKFEIEELKKRPELKGINFDECLEEVLEDEE